MNEEQPTAFYTRIALVVLFTIASLVLCIRVELLNAKSSTPIPFDLPENKQHLKWRLAQPFAIRSEFERRIAEYSELEISQAEREQLIAEARVQLAEELADAELECSFKNAVGQGVFAYFLIPAALFLAFRACLRSNSVPLIGCLSLCIAINFRLGVMVLQRGYLSALTQGW